MGKLTRPIAPARLCKLGDIAAELDPDDLQLVADMVTDGESFRSITMVLRAGDYMIGENVTNGHLRGLCCCPPDTGLWGIRG
jgi:hypothetical protein